MNYTRLLITYFEPQFYLTSVRNGNNFPTLGICRTKIKSILVTRNCEHENRKLPAVPILYGFIPTRTTQV